MQVKTNNIPRMIFAGVLILILAGGLFARRDPGQMNIAKPFADPVGRTLSNIGNWSYWIYNTGTSGNDPNGDPGGVYPRGTAALVFTDGLVWGGYVRDGKEENPRVGGVTYTEGIQQGWITTPGDGTNPPEAISPNDDRAGMWRMRVDYYQLTMEDVRQDAAELNLVNPADASETMMQEVLDEYVNAFENWPTDLGAPYYDVNGNGVYDKPSEFWVKESDPENPSRVIWVWKGIEVDLDGNGEITVGEREEPGIAGADQVLYSVNNDLDEGKSIGLYGAQPMGIELQSTTWAYNQPSATLGQLIFRKYLFINKSGVDIDSMFVCQWSDADIGNYTDDFAGCDTVRSVGYGYSGFVTDPDYTNFNLPPGAIGYDFFQGPMVEGAPEDTAIFGLTKRPGFKNLPMTSYFFFASGSAISDPPLGDYDGTLQFYNMLNGYLPTNDLTDPSPYIAGSGPTAGTATKFPLAGDPTTQQGDVDGLGTNLQPGDRRIGMCSGPFYMTPGDSQEVVVAVIGGIVAQDGGDNRNAVLQMKLNSDFAQFIYDNLFKAIPRANISPKVTATPMEDHIILDWGSDANAVAASEANDPILGFNFEGYNVYQLPTATATVEQAKKVATFDVVNNVTTIYGTKFVGSIGDIVTVPIQKGTDSGIQRYFKIDQDYINGAPLAAGNTYYFAVTAYNFNDDPTVPEPSLESSLLPAITVVPQGTVPGTRYPNENGDMLSVSKTGGSTGSTSVEVVDPAALTAADYFVGFHTQPQYSVADGDTLGTWYKWYLVNTTSGDTLLSQQTNLAGDNDYLVTDGVLARVSGPTTAGLAGWDYDGNRWYSGTNWGAQEFFGGLDIGANFFGSDVTLAELVPVHMVFQDQASVDANGFASKGVFYRRDLGYAEQGIGEIPFECFDVKDAANPRKLNISIVEDDREGAAGANANLIWDMGWNGSEFGENGAREYIFISLTDYDEGAYYANGAADGTYDRVAYAIWPASRSRDYLVSEFTMDIFANLPNTPDDSYTFSTEGVVSGDADLAKADVDKVNVFPNPYYASNPSEPDRFTRFVTFNHLPPKATIRIFSLSGVQVRKIEKDKPDQFQTWDLQNEAGIPVASGLYIAHIDMPEVGKEKVLKLMIIQAQEQLKYY